MNGQRILSILLVTFVLVFGGSFADAIGKPTRGIGLVRVSKKDGQIIDLYSGSHALLIGVSRYVAGWPRLESIPGEMQKLRLSLLAKGFNVVVVMDPDSKRMEGAFRKFIDDYGFDLENRLLIFYSGHGFTRSVGGRQKGYLVPVDAPVPTDDERGFLKKAITMSQVQTWARKIEAKHALFLFDSCFSGTIFKTRALPVPRHITDKTARPVRQFITAGSAGQEVPAKSVFLPSFIRAIEGAGDLDKDGYVTGSELGQYLHKTVLAYNTGQTPQYGKINDPALDEGDFVFRLASARISEAAFPRGRISSSPAAIVPQRIDAEDAFWATITDSSDREDFQDYIRAYPKGRFVPLARLKLRKLERFRRPRQGQEKSTAVGQQKTGIQRSFSTKVALFPSKLTGDALDIIGLTDRSLTKHITSYVNKHFVDVGVIYNYTEAKRSTQEIQHGNFWSDGYPVFTGRNKAQVMQAARKLKAELGLLIYLNAVAYNTGTGGEEINYEIHLVDIKTGKDYIAYNTTESRGSILLWQIDKSFRQAFDKYNLLGKIKIRLRAECDPGSSKYDSTLCR